MADEDLSPTDTGSSPNKPRQASTDDDGEDGPKEHISSATFFSHQPLDKTSGRSKSLSISSDQLSRQESEDQDEMERINRHINDKSRTASFKHENEIEVSIKSEDETQHLLGDLPPLNRTRSGPERGSGSGYGSAFSASASASASETEPEPSDSEDASDHGGQASGADTPRANAMKRPAPVAPQAIDLNPFNHQVGGHTALYRISRHAVCKKLNNRENKFYETVEQYHPELLDFMPR